MHSLYYWSGMFYVINPLGQVEFCHWDFTNALSVCLWLNGSEKNVAEANEEIANGKKLEENKQVKKFNENLKKMPDFIEGFQNEMPTSSLNQPLDNIDMNEAKPVVVNGKVIKPMHHFEEFDTEETIPPIQNVSTSKEKNLFQDDSFADSDEIFGKYSSRKNKNIFGGNDIDIKINETFDLTTEDLTSYLNKVSNYSDFVKDVSGPNKNEFDQLLNPDNFSGSEDTSESKKPKKKIKKEKNKS